MSKDGQITWDFVGAAYAKEIDHGVQPRNAEEARQLILSGEYNHRH